MPPVLLHLVLLTGLAAEPIAVESNQTDPALVHALIDACNEARGAEVCQGAQDAAAASAWRVRVLWQDDAQLRARIEIGHGAPGAPADTMREVIFGERDTPLERHRAVGLIIASYVAERVREQAASTTETAPKSEPPAPPPSEPQTHVEPEPIEEPELISSTRMALDVAVLAGTAIVSGPLQWGLSLRGSLGPRALPVRGLAAVRGGVSPGDTELLFVSGSLGLALELTPRPSPFGLELRAELSGERLQVFADDPLLGSEDGGRFRFGGRLGLQVLVAVSRTVSLFVDGDGALLVPAVSIEVGGERIGHVSAAGAAGMLGVRVAD